jgi:DNA mismatch endonuclease (patch repair protein)
MTKSEQMAKVGTKNTAPEVAFRRELSARGIRYRLHRRDLPGKPDVYVGRLRLAIFVNGCFWHGHGCSRGRLPSTNGEFWREKIARNRRRDEDVARALKEREVEAICVWPCDRSQWPAVADDLARRYEEAR